jgi:pyridoxamine 5'-phosphate oxidase
MTKLSHLRNDYGQFQLQRPQLNDDPIEQLKAWMADALAKHVLEPTAMCLSTVDEQGMPNSRIVLLKDITENGLTFFTNYLSDKGKQMERNNKVALNLFWPELERQVRVRGVVKKTSPQVSDVYFASRPAASRLGAWASPQSQVVDDEFVVRQYELMAAQYADKPIERPPHWGGYEVIPSVFEFWQGRASRLHDRFRYAMDASGGWHIERLAP